MFLGVPATVPSMDSEERGQLGRAVEQARLRKGWAKEHAARVAEVSTTTWRRVEEGLTTQDAKLAKVLRAVGLDGQAETAGLEDLDDDTFLIPEDLEEGYSDVARFAAAVRNHCPPLASRAARLKLDATALFAEAGRYLAERGGDGRAEEPRGSAPTSRDDYDLAAHGDEKKAINDENELGTDQP